MKLINSRIKFISVTSKGGVRGVGGVGLEEILNGTCGVVIEALNQMLFFLLVVALIA